MVSPSQDPTAPRIDPTGVDSSGGNGHTRETVTDDQTPQAHLKAAQRRFEELKEYVSYLVSAKIDALKLTMVNAGIYAALGIVGLMALSALVVTAVVLVCNGFAGGLATMFGHRLWLGNLVAGIVLLGAIAGVAWFGLKKVTGASKERTLKKYAARQQQQRAKFGEDVEQAASNPAD
jgi:hypothetical protein